MRGEPEDQVGAQQDLLRPCPCQVMGWCVRTDGHGECAPGSCSRGPLGQRADCGSFGCVPEDVCPHSLPSLGTRSWVGQRPGQGKRQWRLYQRRVTALQGPEQGPASRAVRRACWRWQLASWSWRRTGLAEAAAACPDSLPVLRRLWGGIPSARVHPWRGPDLGAVSLISGNFQAHQYDRMGVCGHSVQVCVSTTSPA